MLLIFPSILTSLPVPAAKTSPQHDAATTMLHRRDGAMFLPDVRLGILAKEFNLGFIRTANLVSEGAFWQTLPSPQRNSGALSE